MGVEDGNEMGGDDGNENNTSYLRGSTHLGHCTWCYPPPLLCEYHAR
jgi:hypothetical protein